MMGERLIGEVGGAADIAAISLRYFNVVGAGSPALADTKTAGLLAQVLAARRQGFPVTVNGRHHATPDGTAVRDYVHAADIADAHVAAVARMTAGWWGTAAYNVGTGQGTSVLQLLSRVARVSGGQVPWIDGPARSGDPAWSVADASLIVRELGWRPTRNLDDALASAWAAGVDRAVLTSGSRNPRRLAAAG
jgi:UDP-glucose 4-epimerase